MLQQRHCSPVALYDQPMLPAWSCAQTTAGGAPIEDEGRGQVRAAAAEDPALVEGGDVVLEAAHLADLLQEVVRAQQARVLAPCSPSLLIAYRLL